MQFAIAFKVSLNVFLLLHDFLHFGHPHATLCPSEASSQSGRVHRYSSISHQFPLCGHSQRGTVPLCGQSQSSKVHRYKHYSLDRQCFGSGSDCCACCDLFSAKEGDAREERRKKTRGLIVYFFVFFL